MEYAGFSTMEAASKHRANNGGWIFAVSGQSLYIWFNPKYTATGIFSHHATNGLSGVLE